jgi:hypothetical protein
MKTSSDEFPMKLVAYAANRRSQPGTLIGVGPGLCRIQQVNFGELRKGEVRRIPIPRTRVNRGPQVIGDSSPIHRRCLKFKQTKEVEVAEQTEGAEQTPQAGQESSSSHRKDYLTDYFEGLEEVINARAQEIAQEQKRPLQKSSAINCRMFYMQ